MRKTEVISIILFLHSASVFRNVDTESEPVSEDKIKFSHFFDDAFHELIFSLRGHLGLSLSENGEKKSFCIGKCWKCVIADEY